MKAIKIIIFLIIILSISPIAQEKAAAEGIIIADDQKILEVFRDYDQEQIIALAQKISEYDKVILHLGAQKVFSRGHPFFYRTSRANLKVFAEQLQKQNQKFYIWFLDSFGSEMFKDIYHNHQKIIEANHDFLKGLDLNYDGIVIDLEWINLGLKANQKENQAKYLEILKSLRNNFQDKEVYAFMSLVEDKTENIRRGYNEEKILNFIDNIIVMLYIKDAGFYLAEGKLNMIQSDNRIDNLRGYYQKNNYQIAVSLEGGIFLERDENIYFIKTISKFEYKEQSQLLYQKEKKHYQVSGYRLEEGVSLKRNDYQLVELKKDERLHFLEIKKRNLLKEDDYIWEYFQLQK